MYEPLRGNGIEHVVVVGDFNDTPASEPLNAFLEHTDLTDFVEVTPFDDGSPDDDRPGPFANGTKSNKIDYLLLSPSLLRWATRAEIIRKGVWGGVNGTLFPHFDTIEDKNQAGSDHAAVVFDLDIS